jgi:hypothetical protein
VHNLPRLWSMCRKWPPWTLCHARYPLNKPWITAILV